MQGQRILTWDCRAFVRNGSKKVWDVIRVHIARYYLFKHVNSLTLLQLLIFVKINQLLVEVAREKPVSSLKFSLNFTVKGPYPEFFSGRLISEVVALILR